MRINNTNCPICSSDDIDLFITRSDVPTQQNRPIYEQNISKNMKEGHIELCLCLSCGFIYNRLFDSSLLLYDEKYDNTQSCSPLFSKYLHDLETYLIVDCGIKNKKIIEVGCGKGQFIKELCDSKSIGNEGIGFDPTYVGNSKFFDGRVSFEKRFYDVTCIEYPADIVICRHVIEHISNPIDLLINIRKALVNSPHARIFFETPCVEWILKNKVIWDFFYEHCSYFTKESLTTAFEISGFKVENVKHIFGGQYLWFEASIPKNKPEITKNLHNIHYLVKEFSKSEHKLIDEWKNKIQKFSSSGKIAIWGAGAKGVTLVNLIDPECKLIDCVIDLNPNKQNKYISGTGHIIINYNEITDRNIKYIILMNPNYFDENNDLLKKANIDIEFI